MRSDAHSLECPGPSTLANDSLSNQLREWSGSASPYPHDHNLAEVFEEVVRAYPNACALSFGDKRLSYIELNARANRLARHLRQIGVGTETLVGLCLERSVEMIVALIAILKAGGAYVPIDPTLPRERVDLLLGDTKLAFVLTQDTLAAALLEGGHLQLVSVDDNTLPGYPSSNLQRASGPGNLAYVMYTSGSTGKPKGVMIEQRSVIRLVRNTNYCDFGAQEVFLQAAPISFDASTFEIWGALLNGGRLVVLPPKVSSLEELGNTIVKNRVTTIWLTSGLFNLMVEQRLGDLKGVTQILTGGDVVSPAHAREVLENLPNSRLVNGYGPTENTTFTCCNVMKSGESIFDSVPIGKPVSNTQVFLLDADRNPVPPGAVGEIYAAGEGLARGYLNDPELTAEHFLANPFASKPGQRMYRTGDLASWRPEGTLEFVGRIDDQVKILGHRVEPLEVECALRSHPFVRQVHVGVETSPMGSKRLVAYVVGHSNSSPLGSDLRTFLNRKLPPYMVPSSFVSLPSIPLHSNGKVDRDALRRVATLSTPARIQPTANSCDVQELEGAIISIWRDLLLTDQITPDANFFDLGGNSLLLASMHDRMQTALKVTIPIVDLFEFTTVERLAKRILELRSL
ncbi:MAG: hypothetical protein C5B56_13830, partial [Proteobacteria bacterium]